MARTAIALVVVLVAACGGAAEPTTTAAPTFPSVVVDAWLDALGRGDYEAAAGFVHAPGASIVVAVENDLSEGELAELLESGWTPELEKSFWSSFREDFAIFSGTALDSIIVGRHNDLSGPAAVPFAAVSVEVDGTEGLILTRATPEGVWQVDLLATMGGAFVPLVFDRVATLGAGTAADLVRREIAGPGLESLDAAAVAYPQDVRLETEIARIRTVLGAP